MIGLRKFLLVVSIHTVPRPVGIHHVLAKKDMKMIQVMVITYLTTNVAELIAVMMSRVLLKIQCVFYWEISLIVFVNLIFLQKFWEMEIMKMQKPCFLMKMPLMCFVSICPRNRVSRILVMSLKIKEGFENLFHAVIWIKHRFWVFKFTGFSVIIS